MFQRAYLMMTPGRRSKFSSTTRNSSFSDKTDVPYEKTVTDNGFARPIAYEI